ncbi:hypothetical protein PR048_021408 [Dryococelus australis]|uniref:Uncharacterized protein n=1 Tax=Dryococelus australis TaxID=614101 RepID=A0ABQ9GY47_9NEOP|nr:hypothetical protein PR048_021408 [Dryococelus australis]
MQVANAVKPSDPADPECERTQAFIKCFLSRIFVRIWGCGSAVARAPAPHQGEPGSIPGGAAPRSPHGGNRTRGCRWLSGSLRELPPSPPPHSCAAPSSPRLTRAGSQDLDVKGHPNLNTPPPSVPRQASGHPTQCTIRFRRAGDPANAQANEAVGHGGHLGRVGRRV